MTAAASSSSADRAQKFLQEMKCPSSAKAYGSYAELAADPNVDVIYVATPHSHHYQNVMLCLEHDKHVLCEKSFTVNAPQTEKLVQVAKEKGLFLMEAVWTRHFPLSVQIRSAIEKGEIGPVYRAFADLSLAKDVEGEFGTKHRMVNMDLAGGALLDCKLAFSRLSVLCVSTEVGKKEEAEREELCAFRMTSLQLSRHLSPAPNQADHKKTTKPPFHTHKTTTPKANIPQQ